MSDLKSLVAHLARMSSTLGGLDGCLMLAQYSSPFIIALLLRLARLRSSIGTLGTKAIGTRTGGSAEGVARGLGNVAASISEARLVMRLLGVLPVISGLMRLYPRPVQSAQSLLKGQASLAGPKAIPTIQSLSLVGYYALEQTAWLGKQGVLNIAPQRLGKAAIWSVRCWALYVFLELYKLQHTYNGLKAKTQAAALRKPKVSVAEAEGYEVPSSSSEKDTAAVGAAGPSDQKELRDEWETWQLNALQNWSYAPLTLHWSTPGGLWSNAYVTASLGLMAAASKVAIQWRNA